MGSLVNPLGVSASEVPNESITTEKLAPNAVTGGKISTGAVTEGKIANEAVAEGKLASAVQNKLLTLTAATALATKAEKTETEPSATKPAFINAQLEGATLTRTKIKVLVGATIVAEAAISATSAGVTVVPLSFIVPAGSKWQWEKVEGTIEAFKFSTTIL